MPTMTRALRRMFQQQAPSQEEIDMLNTMAVANLQGFIAVAVALRLCL